MNAMFYFAFDFNQPLDNWDVSSSSWMHDIFRNAGDFNQCLSTWAAKVPDNAYLEFIFNGSNCTVQSPTPRANVSPWCQTESDGCDRGPTEIPIVSSTEIPIVSSTKIPIGSPTRNPTENPTKIPTGSPTRNPTESPTKIPTGSPTLSPTGRPTRNPTESPTGSPTEILPITTVDIVFEICGPCDVSFPSDLEPIIAANSAETTVPTPALLDIDISAISDPSVDCRSTPCALRNLFGGRALQDTGTTLFRVTIEVPGTVDEDGIINSNNLAADDINNALVAVDATFVVAALVTPSPTEAPTRKPTGSPTKIPTGSPSDAPSNVPSVVPSDLPSKSPSDAPSNVPSDIPSDVPSDLLSQSPSDAPSNVPTENPTASPTENPTENPLCKNNPGQFSLSAELACSQVAVAGRKLRNDLCNNLPGNIKNNCPQACKDSSAGMNDADLFTFTSETSCTDILNSVSKKTIAILCGELFFLAENCPQFCPATESCPCVDSVVPFQVFGVEVTASCAAVEGLSIKVKKKVCKRKKIKIKCPGACAVPGCD